MIHLFIIILLNIDSIIIYRQIFQHDVLLQIFINSQAYNCFVSINCINQSIKNDVTAASCELKLPLECTHSGRDNLHFLLDGEITYATVYSHFPPSAHLELQTMVQVFQDPEHIITINCLLVVSYECEPHELFHMKCC